ncbi:hypothetical protein AKO1_006783 [Acrasis kona]|uniref:Uncharacterized protein n=1 Tax=Acrasis kona TaxID=1008807 RepID=A0AAW2YU04_9EUKA
MNAFLPKKNNNIAKDKDAHESSPTFEEWIFNKLEEISDQQITIGLDKKHKLVNIMLPKMITEAEQKDLSAALLELTIMFPQPFTKCDDRHRNCEEIDVYHFFEWSPIGHPLTRVVSRQSIAKGKVTALPSVANIKKAFFKYRRDLSSLIKAVDKEMYEECRRVVAGSSDEFKTILQSCIEEVFLGCAINTGQCANHRDFTDVKQPLSALSAFGFFSGAFVCFPELGIKFPQRPGCTLMFSSEVVQHFVSPYAGYRFGVVHCSHDLHKKSKEKSFISPKQLKRNHDVHNEKAKRKMMHLKKTNKFLNSLYNSSDEEEFEEEEMLGVEIDEETESGEVDNDNEESEEEESEEEETEEEVDEHDKEVNENED